jgi:RNA polymerase sigma factor for flagellar operon FliA
LLDPFGADHEGSFMTRRKKPVVPLTEAQKELATRFVHLCLVVANRFARRYPELYEDFRQAAGEGLCDAAKKWREDFDVKFETYAIHRMNGSCLDMMRQNGLVRGSRSNHYKVFTIISIDQDWNSKTINGDEAVNSFTASNWTEFILPPSSEPEPSHRMSSKEEFDGWLRNLPEREKTLLRCHYGPERMTLRDIAPLIGITESRIHQIHRSLLDRLKAKADLPMFRELWSA